MFYFYTIFHATFVYITRFYDDVDRDDDADVVFTCQFSSSVILFYYTTDFSMPDVSVRVLLFSYF